MRPSLTFADVSPPRAIVSFRLHAGTGDWLPIEPNVLDLMAGSTLIYSGELTVVCHRGCITEAVRALLNAAGHDISESVTYEDRAELESHLRSFASLGRKIVVSHIPASGLLDPSAYVVHPGVLVELNHKAYLGRFVPAEYVISRQYIPIEAYLDDSCDPITPPVVLKAATQLPTGAGFDVMVCGDATELARARTAFVAYNADGVVVESFKRFKRTWCAQVAIAPSTLTYLGAAEQVCSDEGRWLGNYCGAGYEPPADLAAIALAIACAGREAGYIGLSGFDVGQDSDGRYWVFDLNFRACGSTVQLLLHDDLCTDDAHAVSRNARFASQLDMTSVLQRLDAFIRTRHFIPTVAFDGPAVGRGPSLVSGYLVGSGTVEIEEIRRRVEAALA